MVQRLNNIFLVNNSSGPELIMCNFKFAVNVSQKDCKNAFFLVYS